jgi:phage terminase small subunit
MSNENGRRPPSGLSAKQQRFVAEYLVDLNATQAAIRAGYSAKWAEKNATRLTGNDGIAHAIAEGTARQLEKAELTAQKVKDRIALLAFQDMREFFDEAGNLLSVHQFSDGAAARVASFEIIKKNAAAGDGVIDTVHKIKTVDVVKNLEMLAKHFGLLVDKVEHSGDLTIKWQDQE